VDAEGFWRPGPAILRLRGSAGGLSAAAGSSIPSPAEALWVGGTTTVRGIRERALATRRFGAVQVEAGAPFLLEEGRAYLFFDAAWFRRLQDLGGIDHRTGWGAGMAARTGRQTLALDLGIPGSGGFSEGRIHLRLESVF
jgi:hemolysin activation/secretion protein